ncbi:hypothetical protein LZ31DRAFT_45074 [Colletotrichum somersetense]|nr:hypothetical protein LZ31DRAFT_45074 [Colletotrichum somersetense]
MDVENRFPQSTIWLFQVRLSSAPYHGPGMLDAVSTQLKLPMSEARCETQSHFNSHTAVRQVPRVTDSPCTVHRNRLTTTNTAYIYTKKTFKKLKYCTVESDTLLRVNQLSVVKRDCMTQSGSLGARPLPPVTCAHLPGTPSACRKPKSQRNGEGRSYGRFRSSNRPSRPI